jgi:hypothetical protein
VDIDIADPLAMQGLDSDELQHLFGTGRHSGWQVLKQFENRIAVAKTAASDLSQHERVHQDLCSLKQRDQPCVASPQVIDPHRGVDQDQAGFPVRLRGAALREGWVPPSRARRLALSRSMSALKPSLKMAVLSMGPTSLAALARSSSSTLMVVRIV